MKAKFIINPVNITAEDCPLIVFSDHSSGFIQWIIKWRTKASYSHAMVMIEPGKFASQGNVFSNAPLSRYIKRGNRLKFWKVKELTVVEKKLFEARVNKKLNLPWWKRNYDYLGIFGQATGLRFFNVPWKQFCSEVVRDFLKEPILSDLPRYPSPKDLDQWFEGEKRLEVFGYWFDD